MVDRWILPVRMLMATVMAATLAVATFVLGSLATVAAADAAVATEPGTFNVVTPARLLDTRNGTGAPRAAVPAGGSVELRVTGGSVPAGAGAVALNVTVTQTAAAGYVTVFPTGTATPAVSSVNFSSAGQTVANAVTVKVGTGGSVTLRNGSTRPVHLIADVSGWYTAGTPEVSGSFGALNPSRLLDTRNNVGTTAGIVPANGAVTFKVSGRGGVSPGGTGAVALNLTATGATAAGYVTAYPAGTARPNASNLNLVAGQTVAGAVTVKLSTSGEVTLYNGSTRPVHLIADVAGWFVAGYARHVGAYNSLAPARVLDTRNGIGSTAGVVPGGGAVTLTLANRAGVPASGAGAVVLNVTVVRPVGAGYVTVYPADSATVPGSSSLNFKAGRTVPNQVSVGLSADGKVTLRNGSPEPVHLLADIAGWYSSVDTPVPPASVNVTGDVRLGGTITLTGAGWVHPQRRRVAGGRQDRPRCRPVARQLHGRLARHRCCR